MDEIDPEGAVLPLQQRTVVLNGKGSPAHVRNAFTGQFRKPLHAPGNKTKARTTSFRTGIKEELQAEADAEQRLPVLIPGLQEWNKACCFKTLHGRVKGAYSRKDQRLTAIEIIW